MNDKEVAIKFRKIKEIMIDGIDWYKKNKDDKDLLYDEAWEIFHALNRGEAQAILELLSEDD